MKRATIKFRSAQMERKRVDSKKLAKFLEGVRSNGQSDEETAVLLGTSRDTIYAWRNQLRFPKKLMIQGIEAKFGVKIL